MSKQKRQDYYQQNKEAKLEYQRNRINSSREAHLKQLWSGARVRAKKEGVVFTIKPEDIFIPDVCPLLDIQLAWCEYGHGSGGSRDQSPSLDRVVPNLGYVKGNVRVISALANRGKSNLTREQYLMLLSRIVDYLG